jgi:hypothetical protein
MPMKDGIIKGIAGMDTKKLAAANGSLTEGGNTLNKTPKKLRII